MMTNPTSDKLCFVQVNQCMHVNSDLGSSHRSLSYVITVTSLSAGRPGPITVVYDYSKMYVI